MSVATIRAAPDGALRDPAYVGAMIGIAGTIVLLPLALLALAFGLVRFGINAIRALVGEGFAKAGQRLAFHG